MRLDLETVLTTAIQQLHCSETARLDAELLLAQVLQKPRSFLRAFPETVLSELQYQHFQALLMRRSKGEPIAYILGEKEFYSLPLKVTPDVLIPRADTELLVEKILQLFPTEKTIKICDLGTGSGAIALALAQQRSCWQIVAIDNSPPALQLARENAAALNLHNVEFIGSDWLQAVTTRKFEVIVSNPPYIDLDDPQLEASVLQYEPNAAVFAADAGLADLKTIALQAQQALLPNGWLLLEHGYRQSEQVAAYLKLLHYQQVQILQDLSGLPRVTYGQFVMTN